MNKNFLVTIFIGLLLAVTLVHAGTGSCSTIKVRAYSWVTPSYQADPYLGIAVRSSTATYDMDFRYYYARSGRSLEQAKAILSMALYAQQNNKTITIFYQDESAGIYQINAFNVNYEDATW